MSLRCATAQTPSDTVCAVWPMFDRCIELHTCICSFEFRREAEGDFCTFPLAAIWRFGATSYAYCNEHPVQLAQKSLLSFCSSIPRSESGTPHPRADCDHWCVSIRSCLSFWVLSELFCGAPTWCAVLWEKRRLLSCRGQTAVQEPRVTN